MHTHIKRERESYTLIRDEYVPGWQLLLSLLASFEIVRRDAAAQQQNNLKRLKEAKLATYLYACVYMCVSVFVFAPVVEL